MEKTEEQKAKEKVEMKELLWGKKNMTKVEKIRGWALWLVIFIILMACLKILFPSFI